MFLLKAVSYPQAEQGEVEPGQTPTGFQLSLPWGRLAGKPRTTKELNGEFHPQGPGVARGDAPPESVASARRKVTGALRPHCTGPL